MRADRLIRALFVLQSRPVVTAAELAVELEVSVPTARRDLEALAVAGVPIYPQRGRGGGWRLIGGARTDLTGLTEPEATALFAMLGRVDGAPAAAASALAKLAQALPATFRAGAARAAASTVREAGWGRADAPPEPPEVVTVQRAIAAELQLRIAYRDDEPRLLVPLVVAAKGERWYLLAAPAVGSAGGEPAADVARARMLRLDRIRELEPSPVRGVLPAGFDARDAWERAAAEVERRRGGVRAEVLVAPHAVQPMLDVLGVHASRLDDAGGAREDGRVAIEVRAHRADALAEQLAGWCDAAEVTGPPEVRDALAALGRRLVRDYDRRDAV